MKFRNEFNNEFSINEDLLVEELIELNEDIIKGLSKIALGIGVGSIGLTVGSPVALTIGSGMLALALVDAEVDGVWGDIKDKYDTSKDKYDIIKNKLGSAKDKLISIKNSKIFKSKNPEKILNSIENEKNKLSPKDKALVIKLENQLNIALQKGDKKAIKRILKGKI